MSLRITLISVVVVTNSNIYTAATKKTKQTSGKKDGQTNNLGNQYKERQRQNYELNEW